MATAQYFDTRTGRELSKWDATDDNGILRDGCTIRVKTMLRDSAGTRRRVVDAYNKPYGLNQPGFRTFRSSDGLDTTLDSVAKADAYPEHERYLNAAWKRGATAPVLRQPTADTLSTDERVCPDCGGDGFDKDGSACPRCGGEGTVDDDDDVGDAAAKPAARMTIDAMQRSHGHRMDRIYDRIEHDLQNAWRGSK
jgi:hypothetical protein